MADEMRLFCSFSERHFFPLAVERKIVIRIRLKTENQFAGIIGMNLVFDDAPFCTRVTFFRKYILPMENNCEHRVAKISAVMVQLKYFVKGEYLKKWSKYLVDQIIELEFSYELKIST